MRLREFCKSALKAKPIERKQDKIWSCAAAAVKAVLEQFGYYVPEAKLVKALAIIPGVGSYHSAFKHVLSSYGLYTSELNKANYSQLVEAVNSGNSVITDFHNQYGNHYVVVLNANELGVEFLDTAKDKGKIRKLPAADFTKQWYNTFTPPETISRGWMILISDSKVKRAVQGKPTMNTIPSVVLAPAAQSALPEQIKYEQGKKNKITKLPSTDLSKSKG